MNIQVPVIGICRHRLYTDGEGVSTLVAFHGCPLRCRYCLNSQVLEHEEDSQYYDCTSLYDQVKMDELYFLATGGGITFGGGEPCLQSQFIAGFREACGDKWLLTVETSLNVPQLHIKRLLPIVDRYIVDIKDMNPDIYRHYTGKGNGAVIRNLRLLADHGRAQDVIVRMPLIPRYNTKEDQANSIEELKAMGFAHFDVFTYKTFSTQLS